MNRTQALTRLLTLGAMSWFVFWACAPMMSVPPARPISQGHDKEFGGGIMAQPGEECPDCPKTVEVALDIAWKQGFLWYRRQEPGSPLQWGGTVFAGVPFVSGGGYVRYNLIDNSRGIIGLQLDGGLLYGGIGLPVGIPVDDQGKIWLTVQPSAHFSMVPLVHAPIGMSFKLNDSQHIDTQIGATYIYGEGGGKHHLADTRWTVNAGFAWTKSY
jgi:hypothetical protein